MYTCFKSTQQAYCTGELNSDATCFPDKSSRVKHVKFKAYKKKKKKLTKMNGIFLIDIANHLNYVEYKLMWTKR